MNGDIILTRSLVKGAASTKEGTLWFGTARLLLCAMVDCPACLAAELVFLASEDSLRVVRVVAWQVWAKPIRISASV